MAKCIQSANLNRLCLPLLHHVGALKVVLPLNRDQKLPTVGVHPDSFQRVRVFLNAKPEDVNRRVLIFHRQTGGGAHGGTSPIRTHCKRCMDLHRSMRRLCMHAHHTPILTQQSGDIGLHHDLQFGKELPFLYDEVEKVPLGHEHDIGTRRPKLREVHERDLLSVEVSAQAGHLLMRHFQELFKQAQVLHDLRRRRMDGISSKVTEKVFMLLQHDRLHTCPSHQISQHDPRWPSSCNATLDLHLCLHAILASYGIQQNTRTFMRKETNDDDLVSKSIVKGDCVRQNAV